MSPLPFLARVVGIAAIVGSCLLPAAVVHGFISTTSFRVTSLQYRCSQGPVSLVQRFAGEEPPDTFRSYNEFAKGGVDNDPNDPSTWYDDLPAKDFVQYYARDDITPDEIQEMLKANNIKDLKDVKTMPGWMKAITRDEIMFQMADDLNKALVRSRKTPEKLLGGEVVYDSSCIAENCFNMYTVGAVSVRPIAMAPRDKQSRNTEFSLVMGPSGTGKTLFALRRLPQLACSSELQECFRVHFKASRVAAFMKQKGLHEFTEAVTGMVQTIVQQKLDRKESDQGGFPIDLFLHVTIDEAGWESTKANFESADAILNIVDALKAMKFSFTKGVHVTVAGTGLEEITSTIVSEREATKFRTKPWTEKQFDALVDASNHPDPVVLKDVVRKYAILRDLITNGRCSYYIVVSSTTTRFLQDVLARGFVKVLVSAVANEYINSNGMESLKTSEQKWEVCRSVWRQLDKATSLPGVAFLPQFDDIQNLTVRDSAKLLMDVHVELKEGVPEFVDNNCDYSLSVSPALAIVMARLLNAKAELSWDWPSFETVVVLSELKYLVANSDDIPRKPERPIIELRDPFPSSKGGLVPVPIMSRYCVVLNGPRSPYADIIAPYRLVQPKFTNLGAAGKAELNLLDELDKMGLLKKCQRELQQLLTSKIYRMWGTLESVPSPSRISLPFESILKQMRCECYPYNTLTTPESVEEPIMILYDPATMKFRFSKEDADQLYTSEAEREALIAGVEAMNEAGPLMEFNELRPVTAVFATNAAQFDVPRNYLTKNFAIRREQVDWKGVLIKPIAEVSTIEKALRGHVHIRFQFY